MGQTSLLTGRRTGSALLACAALALAASACESGGHFTLLGYTTQPNYDCNIRTVRVPIFQNRTFIQGVEFDLTRAVIREIEQKTPYKVVGPGCDADTELTGTVVSFTKNILSVNQLNEVREAETTLGVEVVWKDLRTGEYLSKPSRRPGEPVPEPPAQPLLVGVTPGAPVTTAPSPPPGAPAAVPPAPGPLPPPGVVLPPGAPQPGAVLIRSLGGYIPELGQSLTTALQRNVNSMAVQIVQMMEKPW
jgi:hypothetical protein